MSLSSKLSITDVDLKGKRVLIRVSCNCSPGHMPGPLPLLALVFLMGLTSTFLSVMRAIPRDEELAIELQNASV